MSEKARLNLKHGRIFSAGNDGMCGIDFNLGELYLIAGSTPNVGICNYVKQYSKMTLVEKRGVAGGYKKGCECKVCVKRPVYTISTLVLEFKQPKKG